MKRIHLPLLLLILVLLLTACTVETTHTCVVDGYTVTVDSANRTITHGSDVYTYSTFSSGNTTKYTIIYPDGSHYNYQRSGNLIAAGFDPGDNGRYISGMVLVSAINKGAKSKLQVDIDDILPGLICGIALILIGIYNINDPEHVFHTHYGWAVENAQPTEQYLKSVSAGGFFLIAGGILVILIAVS